MTDYTTLVRMAPAVIVDQGRQFCDALAEGDAGSGELTTGLVPIGSEPGTEPTWYITDGPIAVDMAAAMLDPEQMHLKCAAAGIEFALEACAEFLAQCVFAEGGQGRVVMSEMGLELAVPRTPIN